jgi:hypothetical protein
MLFQVFLYRFVKSVLVCRKFLTILKINMIVQWGGIVSFSVLSWIYLHI